MRGPVVVWTVPRSCLAPFFCKGYREGLKKRLEIGDEDVDEGLDIGGRAQWRAKEGDASSGSKTARDSRRKGVRGGGGGPIEEAFGELELKSIGGSDRLESLEESMDPSR
ncbi:hypothetical protein BSKO_02675 [Bryopsis sp. KO-2023]|nr:hypothetical protein BSKO_02675 [Bryopsis sp. KO-2023]